MAKHPVAARRNASSRGAILDAAFALVGEVGYARLTIEAIAARAGVGKQTIYRWWPSKGAVLFESILVRSVGDAGQPAPLPDTGDLEADLRAVLRATARELSTPEWDRPLRALTVAMLEDEGLAEEHRTRVEGPTREVKKARLRAARRAGQLPLSLDLDRAVDALFAPLAQRWLTRGGPLTDQYADAQLAVALDGLRRAGAGDPTAPDGARRAGAGGPGGAEHPAGGPVGAGRETWVEVGGGYRLWAAVTGGAEKSPLLLVHGANTSGDAWPDELVARLARHHRVIRYDHRDTGRSTHAHAERPYPLRDLAADAVAVLDALDVERAHVVGMSLGGTLVQLLLLDHPDRLLSATLLGTSALEGGPAHDLPGPDPRLLELWSHLGDPRDEAAELEWRVAHWRLLNGDALPFDPEEFRALERRVAAHSGTWVDPVAHATADRGGLDRGAELGSVTVPTLVLDAPADPVVPPPNAARLTGAIPSARLVAVPGLGHALGRPVLPALAGAITGHTAAVDAAAP